MIETVPGSSITLRDVLAKTVVRVNERMASRTLTRSEWVAARVIPRGCSGGPELEMGVLHVPELWQERVLAGVKARCHDFVEEFPDAPVAEAFKELPPFFHQAWLASMFDPAVPELRNFDDEELVLTRSSFRVGDAPALVKLLDDAESDGITRTGDSAWGWSGTSASGKPVGLAMLELRDGQLRVETNSVERAARARALLERLAGRLLEHRSTTHEDMRRQVIERVRESALRGSEPPDRSLAPASADIDPQVAEALVLAQLTA